MAAPSVKKGKKTKGKTIHLNEFLSKEGGVAAGPGSSYVYGNKPNWADESEEDDLVMSTAAPVSRVQLPTAPKASRECDVDPSKVPKEPPYIAFLGNLPFDASKEDIIAFFGNLPVKNIRIPNGRKGIGYAEFEDVPTLLEALSFHNNPINNRSIRVDLADQYQSDSRDSLRQHGMYDDDRDPSRMDGDWRRKDPSTDDSSKRYEDTRTGESNNDRLGGGGSDEGRWGGGSSSFDRWERKSDDRKGSSDEKWGHDDDRSRQSDFGSRRAFGGGDKWGSSDSRRDGFDRRSGIDDNRRRGYDNRRGGYEDRRGGYEDRRGDRRVGYEDRRSGYEDRRGGYEDRRGGYEDRRGDRRGGYDDNRRSGGYEDRGSEGTRERRDNNGEPLEEDESRKSNSISSERPKLKLQPRSVPHDSTQVDSPISAIFGGAKPVDTACKEKEIEERLEKLKFDEGSTELIRDNHVPRERKISSSSTGKSRAVVPPPESTAVRCRTDSYQSDEAETAGDRPVMVPAPLPKENAWSSKKDFSAWESEKNGTSPAASPAGESQDDGKQSTGKRKDSTGEGASQQQKLDGPEPGSYGRGRGRSRGQGRGQGQASRGRHEKVVPTTFEQMPQVEQEMAKDWSNANKFDMLEEEQ